MRRLLYVVFAWLSVYHCCAQNLLLEAEDFEYKGGWKFERDNGTSGKGMLMVTVGSGRAADALTVISTAKEGVFEVWTRTRDYKFQSPGTRLSCVIINEQQLAEQGKHGNDGYYWERVGRATLLKGENVIRLRDTKMNYARVDAIFFTPDSSFNPNAQPVSNLLSFLIKPSGIKLMGGNEFNKFTPFVIPNDYKEVNSISNGNVRFRVLKSAKDDTSRIITKIEVNSGGNWISLDSRMEDCRIFLITADNTSISYGNYLPSWTSAQNSKYIVVNGVKYNVIEKDDAMNPYNAGDVICAVPRKIISVSDSSILLGYTLPGDDTLTASWKIKHGAAHVDLDVLYRPKKNGYYSLAVEAFQGIDSSLVSNVQLPPLYQYQRVPDKPTLIPLAMSPQPLSIVEIRNAANNPFSFFITGAPSQFSQEWSAYDFGLGLKGIDNKVQPVAFSPILGLEGSYNKKGSQIEKSFKLGIMPVGWSNALKYISDSIFFVKDYRRQATSLTSAIFNMIDLMKNDTVSAWSYERKGFLDIESDPARLTEVAQSSPLTVLSAAVLTDDEDLYIRRALPIVEYTLSRKGYRWGIPTKQNHTAAINEFNPFISQFNTAYFEGVNFLLDGQNLWIKKIAMPNGMPRYSKGYGVNEGWTGDLAAYKLTKDSKWLSSARQKADEFVFKEIFGIKSKLLNPIVFYNAESYPAWSDLLDLYDITGDKKYQTAAEYGAYQTIAGIRAYPIVRDENILIHPKGIYVGNSTIFWKDSKRFKLGYPRTPGDVKEKKVPVADVSPVGLGFEQPTTLFSGRGNTQHVYMSSWAPSLLRLSRSSGENDFFQTYARNAVIGRFANYPGYYAAGYTDLVLDSAYPYKGPDVTSIYYHHIPAHLSFSLDFLVTEAIQRSKGAISFPYARQNGFVWFSNRIYGKQHGQIAGESVSLFLKRGLVNISNQAINYLTAISDNKLYLVLLNESEQDAETNITIDSFEGRLVSKTFSKTLKAKGIEIVTFPLLQSYRNKNDKLKPVKNGMKIIDLGKSAGQLYVYRIRSPFGWDSVYGFVSNDFNQGGEGKSASLSLEGSGNEIYKNSFPYEWSMIKINPGEKVNLLFSIKEGDAKSKTLKIEI